MSGNQSPEWRESLRFGVILEEEVGDVADGVVGEDKRYRHGKAGENTSVGAMFVLKTRELAADAAPVAIIQKKIQMLRWKNQMTSRLPLSAVAIGAAAGNLQVFGVLLF